MKFQFITFVFLVTSQLFAGVIQVGRGRDTLSIPEAISHAQKGDTILVYPGEYFGNFYLTKSIRLQGMNKPILNGNRKGNVIEVSAEGCVIDGFVITNSGNSMDHEDSGIMVRAAKTVIQNCECTDILFGIYLFGQGENKLLNNKITGRKKSELGERGSAIHIWNSNKNIIIGNEISFARDGMYIQNSFGNQIAGNKVHDLRYGLHYMYADSNSFENNVFYNNIAGAAIMYSRGIRFYQNAFVRNRGFASFGILFQGCEGTLAEENFIIDNQVGLFFEGCNHNLFRKNVIAENDVAIQMFSNSEFNIFTENNFQDNLNPLFVVGKGTKTEWSKEKRGNFWSDYDGYDLERDGIGDVPHKIQNVFDYLEGNYPNLRLYLYSPASQALAVAEKTFPFMQISLEKDPFPLISAAGITPASKIILYKNEIGLQRYFISILMIFSSILPAIVLWKGNQHVRR